MAGTQRGRVELIAESAVVRHNPRAEYRGLDEGGLLTQIDTGQHHGLNAVGALIWSLMNGQTFAALVKDVAAQLADPPLELADDIADFVEALQKRKLVDVFFPEPT